MLLATSRQHAADFLIRDRLAGNGGKPEIYNKHATAFYAVHFKTHHHSPVVEIACWPPR